MTQTQEKVQGYESAMFDLECESEKMACERNISKQEARGIICERYDYDFDEGELE